MKPVAEDQEFIGMSAIDLFASGMGAFILIAIIFMVLFAAVPKTDSETPQAQPVVACPELETPQCPECPSAPTPECPVVEVPQCPACEQCEACPEPAPVPQCPPLPSCPAVPECPICPVCEPMPQPSAVEAPEPAPPVVCPEPDDNTAMLPDMDIVFVLDTTNSMYNEIDALKRELHLVVEVLSRMMPTVGIGVVTFNDREQRPVTRHHQLRKLTGDEEALKDIQRFLRSIEPADARGNNLDIPEAVYQGLKDAVGTSFREGVSSRVILVLTDAPAYPDEVSASLALVDRYSSVPEIGFPPFMSDRTQTPRSTFRRSRKRGAAATSLTGARFWPTCCSACLTKASMTARAVDWPMHGATVESVAATNMGLEEERLRPRSSVGSSPSALLSVSEDYVHEACHCIFQRAFAPVPNPCGTRRCAGFGGLRNDEPHYPSEVHATIGARLAA